MEKRLEELKATTRDAAIFTCPHCGRDFERERGLRMHIMRIHENRVWNRRRATSDKARNGDSRHSITVRSPQHPNGAHEHPVQVPNYCPMCGFTIRAIFLAMNFQKEGA